MQATGIIALIFLNLIFQISGISNIVKIGAIFHIGSEEDEKVFNYAIQHIASNRLPGQCIIEPIIKWVDVDTDSIGTAEAACELLTEGVAAIFGPKSPYTRPIVSSIAARHDVPHIEYSWRPVEESVLQSTTINVYPTGKDIAQIIRRVLFQRPFDRIGIGGVLALGIMIGEQMIIDMCMTTGKVLAVLVQEMPWTSFTGIYQTNDGLSRLQEALKLHNPKDNPTTVRQLVEGNDHRSLLKEIAALRETNIILDVNPDIIIEVLKQANEVNLMKDYHTWIISDLDFPGSSIVNTFMNSTVNITGLGILTEKRTQLQTALGIRAVKVESALLYDAVILFNRALENLNLANGWIESPLELVPEPLQCETEGRYLAGRNLTDSIRSEKRINEMTGPMDFDESGQRQTFEMKVIEFQLNRTINTAIINKNELRHLRTEKQREEDIAKKVQKKIYRVTTRLGPPYLSEVNRSDNRGIEIDGKWYDGYSVDLIHEISKVLKFDYTFELVPGNSYGSYNEANKSWDGLVKRLRDHDADLAVCDLTINHQRGEAVDFTMPFMNLGIGILYTQPIPKEQDLFSFLKPFTTEVWICVAGAYVGVSLMLFLFARIAPGEWDNPHPCNSEPEELENSFSLMNSMWMTIGTLMQQGSDIVPKSPSIRMLAGMWWFFILIMVQTYTANLAAFLTTGKMGDTISSVEELAAQTKIKYGALEGGSTSMFFKDSNDSLYQRMWATMNEARPSVFTKTNDEGVNRVLNGKQGYAFFMETTSIEYNIARNCDKLQQIGAPLDNKGYGIAMPPNSGYRTVISSAILELQEKGILRELKDKWWNRMDIKEPCNNNKTETEDDTNDLELHLANVGGMFLVLGCGCAASFIVGILEFLWNVRKVAVHEKITPWEAFVAESKFAVNIWAETKPVKVSNSRDCSTDQDKGGIGRAASVARSMVGSFLRLDMLDKFEKDTPNTRTGKRRSN